MATTATNIPFGYHPDQVSAQIGNLTAPQRWNLEAVVGEQESDTLSLFEGKSKDAFVIASTDLAAGEGFVVNMRTRSGLYQEGVRGTDVFSSNAKYEQFKYGQHGCIIGVHRHGLSMMESVNEEAALMKEIDEGVALETGNWMGRRKFEHGAMALRERLPLINRMWAGPVGRTLETLTSNDIFDRQTAITANGLLQQLGADHANAGAAFGKGQYLMRTLALTPSTALTKLKLDPYYMKAVGESMERGKDNPLWKGNVVDFDNCIFQEHHSAMHDGDGPQGSVLAPLGTLYTAITAGTGVIDIVFGPNPDNEIYYTKQFPGYNYVFQGNGIAGTSDTLGSPSSLYGSTPATFPTYIHGSAGTTENIATGGEHYLMIVNPVNQPGVGFYAYTVGNDGRKITITARLGSATGGSSGAYRGRVTTLPSGAAGDNTATALGYNAGVGVVKWDSTGTYGGVTLTDAHPVGSTILPCNAKGVPIGWVAVLGGGALYRAYGMHQLRRDTKDEEGGFINKRWVRSYFGHRPRVDRQGRGRAVLVGCAMGHPSLNLPKVTS